MRARNIKPGYFRNELLGVDETDPLVMILFAGLWCCADKDGRLKDQPLLIKADVFPYRTIDPQTFNGYLTELERMGFIIRYSVNNQRYIQVLNFDIHQSPHGTEKSKNYPPVPRQVLDDIKDNSATVFSPLNNREESSLNPSDSLIHGFTDSPIQEDSVSVETPSAGSSSSKKSKSAKPVDERQRPSGYEDGSGGHVPLAAQGTLGPDHPGDWRETGPYFLYGQLSNMAGRQR